MIKQAYSLTRKNDPKLPWIMLIAFVVVAGRGRARRHPARLAVPLHPDRRPAGLLAALIVFGRRAQGSAYRQVEGQPGAAAWVLEGMRGDWRVTSGVAGTAQLDAVHRVLGRPGIVLVGEGAPNRVRGLLAQEKKQVARVVGDTPIYDVVVGDGEGQVPLRKLSAHVMKLPRNLTAGRGQRPRPPDERPGRRAACRCPAVRCPAASRCRSASARSAAAAEPHSRLTGRHGAPARAGRLAA